MSNSSFIAPTSPLDKRALGKFELLCRITAGGMSEIFLAHQKGLAGFNKLVVLKTILPDISGEEDFVRMFLDEARTTASFHHPNIAQVYELDTDDGQLFMAMEFVQGCTLVEMARACRQGKEAIPVGMTLGAVRDTALALHYAHNFTDARGRKQIVIHRDVAEKNIMISYEGVTKLLDFGIAKALGRVNRTSVGMVKGTSGYMSPEQIRGAPLDSRSDIFSLGVVMHECLTGLRLFHGKSPEEGMIAALKDVVAPPSKWNPKVSPELDAVVLKSLAQDREKRFASALEFARAIEKAAPGEIWHPEQTAELVVKYFSERRKETQRLLESSFGGELTGEFRLQSVMAQVKAGLDKPRPSVPKHSLPAPSIREKTPMPSTTQPGIAPVAEAKNTKNVDAVTNPERIALPFPQVTTERIDHSKPYADDEAKTMPAVALPDEIKQLRARVAEMARKKALAAAQQTAPTAPVPNNAQDIPPPRLSVPSVANARATQPSGRSTTEETLSVTDARSFGHNEDEGVKTIMAAPSVLSKRPRIQRDLPPNESMDSILELASVKPSKKRLMLIVLLILSLLLTGAGLLVLFEVIPFPF